MPDFKSLKEVADYLKANGYEVRYNNHDGRQELHVRSTWDSATIYKQGAEWVIDTQFDQSGDYFYANDLQGVVSIINQEL